jgi:hypothetical protein
MLKRKKLSAAKKEVWNHENHFKRFSRKKLDRLERYVQGFQRIRYDLCRSESSHMQFNNLVSVLKNMLDNFVVMHHRSWKTSDSLVIFPEIWLFLTDLYRIARNAIRHQNKNWPF